MSFRVTLLFPLLAACLAAEAGAQVYEQILEARGATHLASAQSQERIDQLSDETRTLLTRYQAASRQADSLRVYVDQLEKLIASQETEKRELQEQIDGVTDVEREIMPLMSQMVDMLGRFVSADLPFQLAERQARVERMRELLTRSDVTVAEKYRRVLEAYQIENDFGHTIEAYHGNLEQEGVTREVDFLRIGRLALFYQTRDGEESGTWTPGGWQRIDDGYGRAIRQGLRIAKRQAAPDLLLLPLPAAGPAGEAGAPGAAR